MISRYNETFERWERITRVQWLRECHDKATDVLLTNAGLKMLKPDELKLLHTHWKQISQPTQAIVCFKHD